MTTAGLERGWHGWRTGLQHDVVEAQPELLELPSQSELREYVSDDELDASNPSDRHEWCEAWADRTAGLIDRERSGVANVDVRVLGRLITMRI